MKKLTISVTDAARNFSECLNRAHYQNITFVLLKNGSPFARLIPDGEKVCRGRDLAKALAGTELSAAEATAWHRDMKAAHNSLKAPSRLLMNTREFGLNWNRPER